MFSHLHICFAATWLLAEGLTAREEKKPKLIERERYSDRVGWWVVSTENKKGWKGGNPIFRDMKVVMSRFENKMKVKKPSVQQKKILQWLVTEEDGEANKRVRLKNLVMSECERGRLWKERFHSPWSLASSFFLISLNQTWQENMHALWLKSICQERSP